MDASDLPPVPEGGYGSAQEKVGAHVLHFQRQMLEEQRRNNSLMMELLQELRSNKVSTSVHAMSSDDVANAVNRGLNQPKPLKGNAQVRK